MAYFCPIMLPLAIEFISGLIYGLIACELSQDGIWVEPGDTTLLDSRFVSLSSSVYKCKFKKHLKFVHCISIVLITIHMFILGDIHTKCSLKNTLILVAPIPWTDSQLASESIVTSSIGVVLNVFKIAQIYWSISSPSVNAGLL